jgi:hypothetical protein
MTYSYSCGIHDLQSNFQLPVKQFIGLDALTFLTSSAHESQTCFEHSTDGGTILVFFSLLASINCFEMLTLISTDEVKPKALF